MAIRRRDADRTKVGKCVSPVSYTHLPLVIISDQKNQTLQLAQYVFKGEFATDYSLAFASYLLALLPIVIFYLFAQKQVISGVTNGAVKA